MSTYADLIQFDPIDTVIQLREASTATIAKQLVGSYVFSQEMADRVKVTVLPHLQFEKPADNKALMIVGNYGTGKSHLMSVLSALAEHADLLDELKNDSVKAEATSIAGKFKVIRTELGATRMPIRDFICEELEQALAGWGIEYKFPAQDKLRNHKTAFEKMMAVFLEKFPDQGLLLVVDELLDFLRSRHDQELIMDLNFLREVGEICRGSRFRFMTGAQEALFDTDRFKFAADNLRRVKDRFEQLAIVRNDVTHVVAERLLRKSDEQKALIQEYLSPFAPAYGDLNERLDEYVRLFPIHPGFIRIMQEIAVVEKRVVLRTFSDAMKSLLAQELPSDRPGLVAYDHYWKVLSETPEYKAIPEVAEVLTVANKLHERIEHALTRKAYRPMAKRIVSGLAVHRLTQRDLEVPLGATAEELRDQLCLYDQMAVEMGGDAAANLATQVITVLKEVVRAVDGQFISSNPNNQQYYLDLKKSIDYEALIQKRTDSIDDEALDRAYFTALKSVLLVDPNQPVHVSGYHIWPDALPWPDHNVDREGYLFFGSPKDRSTAVPERDFYLYFLQPFEEPSFKDEKKTDEVFFRLKDMDESFRNILKGFAAAEALGATASGSVKAIYADKADAFRKQARTWLNENFISSVKVTYAGKANRSLPEVAKAKYQANDSLRDIIRAAASALLAEHFAAEAPEYPRFSQEITAKDRPRAAADALKLLAGGSKTKTAVAVLDGLGLLDGDRIEASQSPYAKRLKAMLEAKGAGQVLNRSEIFTVVTHGIEYFEPNRARLEPEWVVVLLGALVYQGDGVLAIPGEKFDAGSLAKIANTDLDDLTNFKHLEAPKDWNISGLRALFDLLGLAPGGAQLLTQNDVEPVQNLQKQMSAATMRLANATAALSQGLTLFNQSLLAPAEIESAKQAMGETKTFLESLQNFNTPGKFKNFKPSASEVRSKQAGLDQAALVEELRRLIQDLGPLASWLGQAAAGLPPSQAWTEKLATLQVELQQKVRDPSHRSDPSFRSTAQGQLTELKNAYIKMYRDLHGQARLGNADDKRKGQLLSDPRLKNLERLATIPSVPAQDFTDLKAALGNLRACWQFTDSDLQAAPVCPHCQLRPSEVPAGYVANDALNELDGRLDELWAAWSKQLVAELEDPTVEQSRNLLPKAQSELLEACISAGELNDPITNELLDALQAALKGLKPLKLTVSELRQALVAGDGPATPKELVKRLEAFLGDRTKGYDQDQVRVVLE